VLGEKIYGGWGYTGTDRRYNTRTLRAEYLTDAVAELRTLAHTELAPLIAHVAARAGRLQLREERLAAGRRGRAAPPEEALPIEVDRGARAPAGDAVVAELACDDSAQRFALIELDAAVTAA